MKAVKSLVLSPHVVLITRKMSSRRTIHIWDRVRPSLWHPLSSLEQSLMDVEAMAHRVFSPRFPPFAAYSPTVLPKLHYDDDEFFKDLPIEKPEEATKRKLQAAAPEYSANSPSEVPDAASAMKESSTGTDGTVQHPSYSSYSYSFSTILDSSGRHVGTARRRYEDSTGRLKATHEREIDGKKLKMVWQRSDAQAEGDCETTCSSGSPDEFEKEWHNTPFGQAEDEEVIKWMKDRELSVYQAFGIEYQPADPLQNSTSVGQKEVEEGGQERKKTIQEMAKRQEEETTPPQFT